MYSGFLIWSLLCYTICAQTTSLSVVSYVNSTFKQFLALPTTLPLTLGNVSQAFANTHVTVMNASLIQNPISSVVQTINSQTTTKPLTPVVGSILVAFNDTFYTHRLWLKGEGANATSVATNKYTDALCTASAGSKVTWECQSTVKTIQKVYFGNTTTGSEVAQATVSGQKWIAEDHLQNVFGKWFLIPTPTKAP